MAGLRPDLVRAETVRLLDLVVEGMADGRLDRAALRQLPPWRAAVLARVARRAQLMPQHELDDLVEEVIKVGANGALGQVAPEPLTPEQEEVTYVALSPGPRDAPEWTQNGMIKQSVPGRHPGSRHPSR